MNRSASGHPPQPDVQKAAMPGKPDISSEAGVPGVPPESGVPGDPPQAGWEQAGNRRRLVLLALILVPSIAAATVVHELLPARGGPVLNGIITGLFVLLFSWISVGFWSAVAGLCIMLRRFDRYGVSLEEHAKEEHAKAVPLTARTALLFPVYNEDARQVAEGIRTVCASLKKREELEHFDIFILSDSTNPDAWVREEEAWKMLCDEEGLYGKLFYRHRRSNHKRKSGNIADFCRRWGKKYTYMIVFDADSVMEGATLTRMVRAMETHPHIGILQTPPKTIKSRSLIARVQQFANHLYGPLFAAGFHYWQLGDAQFWGHNAIIRIEPFIRHCQLPSLPGRSPLGGDILSHDFVESALMRRAGYSVWLAYEFDGSYEQAPPSLIDELLRDRRWCQGNLQHSRLLFTRGFFPTHRALFINGIMSYGSALLWFFFLIASSLQAVVELFVVPDYFPSGPSLFPDWPTYFPDWALTLLGGTAGLLFIPKILAIGLVLVRGNPNLFGGSSLMVLSVLGEVLVSTFLAPVRMVFHSYYVVTTIIGRSVSWNAQNRDDRGTSWLDAIRFHWWGTLLGLVWGWLMYLVNPGFFLWLSPIVAGLALSVPLSVWTSRVSLGQLARRLNLFMTPVDIEPSPELVELESNLNRESPYSPVPIAEEAGFARAVVMPELLALHAQLAAHGRRNSLHKQDRLNALVSKALAGGPDVLTGKEKNSILSDPATLAKLHTRVWELPEAQARVWGIG